MNVYRCPECGRVSSVAPWVKRPICVHAWDMISPEIWDADHSGMNGQPIETSPNSMWRTPGPNTWSEMIPQ